MNLQTIKSMDGQIEYVLLPVETYQALKLQIHAQLKQAKPHAEEFELFDPADYVSNPIALARIQAGLTQAELAERMGVTQAYISKIEGQQKVSLKLRNKVHEALDNFDTDKK